MSTDNAQVTRGWEKYVLHWTVHPRRDRAWYDAEVASQSMTAEKIAQELNVSFIASLGRRVYPKYVEELHMEGAPLCNASAAYYPNRPLCIACDFNHDPLVWELFQVHNTFPPYRVIGEICQRNAIVEDAINEFIIRFAAESRVKALLARNDGWESLYGAHGICQAGEAGHRTPVVIYGDATEEKSTHHTRVRTYAEMRAKLRDAGFTVQMKVPPANPPIARRIEVHNDALSRNLVVVSEECVELRKDYESGVWDGAQHDIDQKTEDDDGSHLTRSHASSAFGYALHILHKVIASNVASTRTPTDRLGSPRDMGLDFIRGWNRPLQRA